MSSLLEARVALEVGVFVQRVASLELDLADVILLSLEKLRGNGAELRKKWPYNVSDKLDVLPSLIKELGLDVRSDIHVLDSAKIASVLEFRNKICHGKIIRLQGSERFYSGFIAKVTLGEPKINDNRQRLIRQEFEFTSNVLRETSTMANCMILEVEEIRGTVWRLFSGWPTYNYSFSKGSLCDVPADFTIVR